MPGIVSLTTSTNFPACVGGLSVTADAQPSDNGKTTAHLIGLHGFVSGHDF